MSRLMENTMHSVISTLMIYAQTREELMRRAQFWEYLGYSLAVLAFLMIPLGIYLEMRFGKKARKRAEAKRKAPED